MVGNKPAAAGVIIYGRGGACFASTKGEAMGKLWILMLLCEVVRLRYVARAALFSVLILAAVGAATADVESPSDLSSVGSQVRETSLGDLVADAFKATAGTTAAIFPAGSLREITIPAGTVRSEDVVKCLQYPNDKIAIIEITGDQLIRALERSVIIYPQKSMGFLQVSGIVFTFDPKAERGSRVVSATIGGERIVKDSKYRIGTTEPLASGAYGYFTIWKKDQIKEVKEKTASQAVKNFLSRRDSVDYQVLNRISLKQE